jgi:hypothetical protein
VGENISLLYFRQLTDNQSIQGAQKAKLPPINEPIKKCTTELNIFKRRNSNVQKAHEKMLTISGLKGNAYQNHTKIPPHPCYNSYHQKHQQQQVLVRMWAKRNLHTMLVRMHASVTSL